MMLGVATAAESTDGERKSRGNSSGGNEVWRRCDGPAVDGLRRFEPVSCVDSVGRLREMGVPEPGGEPAYGGEVAMACECEFGSSDK